MRKAKTTRVIQAMTKDPWSELATSTIDLIGVRVSQPHPLDVYWLRAADGSPGILFRGIAPERVPYRLPKPRGLTLEVGVGHDGLEARMFLRTPEDRDVFRTLCQDVIAWSAAEESRALSTASLFRRLSHWHSLMTRARTTSMEPHEIRGLIGELLFLERIAECHDLDVAIRSWVAPDEHPQDFAMDVRIVEVKTRLAGSRNTVQVSSLEQLESVHLPLFLVVLELAQSDAEDAVSLNGLCDRLGALVQGRDIALEDALQCALLKRGYLRQDAYDADTYRVAGVVAFEVRDGFPRLVRADVDTRIAQAHYQLDLAQLSEYKVDTEAVLD